MKRKLTLPLIVLVIALWGLIFYRLFSGGRDDGAAGPTLARQEQPARITRPAMDSLLLDYPDPFLGEGAVEPGMEEPWDGAGEAYVSEPEVPYIDWSQVQYFGTIRGEGGVEVALVNINGREHMLKLGDTLEGYTVLGTIGTSLSLRYQGQVGTVTLQHGPSAEAHGALEHEYP